MLKIAICYDNKSICSEIENIILDYDKENLVKFDIEVFYTGENLINFIKNEHSFDLVFLDIELGGITGIGVGQAIRGEFDDYISKIVFITSKDGYEQELFDVQPLNFIKKPLDYDKIINCLNLAIKLLGIDNKTFEYKKGYDLFKVQMNDILYFESKRKQIKIVTFNSEDSFYDTLLNIKEKIPNFFIQPHGSFLVNFNHIKRITNESIFLKNDFEIPISQRNLKYVRDILINFEKEKRNA